MCDALNKDATNKQVAALDAQLCAIAAQIIRSRVQIVESLAGAKAFMESSCKEGLRTRVAYVDWNHFGCVQTKGAWSKALCKQPAKEMQKDVGQKLMILPYSPINGTVLIRSGQISIDHFNGELTEQFPYPWAILFPSTCRLSTSVV